MISVRYVEMEVAIPEPVHIGNDLIDNVVVPLDTKAGINAQNIAQHAYDGYTSRANRLPASGNPKHAVKPLPCRLWS